MEPLTVYPIIYVLECDDSTFYIGVTYDLNKRWAEHISGRGSKFTKLHRPLRIVEVITDDANFKKEAETARRYIEKYGRESVAGGGYK